jgi:hypothetical protein
MPREVVEIPISREPLYEAVAVFLAVLAYPDQDQEKSRAHFAAAWEREHLKARAEEDEGFAVGLLPIRPALFLMSDAAVADEMAEGAKRLADRKEAAVDAHKLFEASETGRAIETIRAFDEKVKNNAEGRALMTRR